MWSGWAVRMVGDPWPGWISSLGGEMKSGFFGPGSQNKTMYYFVYIIIYICVYYTEILNFRLYYTKKCWLFCLDFLVNFKTASSELEVTWTNEIMLELIVSLKTKLYNWRILCKMTRVLIKFITDDLFFASLGVLHVPGKHNFSSPIGQKNGLPNKLVMIYHKVKYIHNWFITYIWHTWMVSYSSG